MTTEQQEAARAAVRETKRQLDIARAEVGRLRARLAAEVRIAHDLGVPYLDLGADMDTSRQYASQLVHSKNNSNNSRSRA